MAYLECHYFSPVLKHNVTVHIVIPTPEGNEQITSSSVRQNYNYDEGMPVVYLLHGAYGNGASWIRFSNIDRYAQSHKCIAVMPSVNNSFYQDMFHGENYRTFMTEELPNYICSLFPASKKREDTYIAGFSMGGYGAYYLALSKPELYCKAASMSGALDIVQCYDDCISGKTEAPFSWNDIFDKPDKLENSNADLFFLYQKCLRGGIVPKLYQSCGTNDFLFDMNNNANLRFKELKADLIYKIGNGSHDWDYWDLQIRDVLEWMFKKD